MRKLLVRMMLALWRRSGVSVITAEAFLKTSRELSSCLRRLSRREMSERHVSSAFVTSTAQASPRTTVRRGGFTC